MDCLGFLVENRVITGALFERMKQLPSVRLFSPTSVQEVQAEQQPTGATAVTTTKSSLN